MHFCSYRIRVVCDECGSNVSLDQPAKTVRCSACGEEQSVDAEFQQELLTFEYALGDPKVRTFLEGGGMYEALQFGSGGQLFAKRGMRPPTCNTCETPTDLARLPLGTNAEHPCARCGTIMATRPADPWLLSIAPTAVQVFIPRAPAAASADRPITLGCPECGAKLKVTATDRRIVTCTFCNTDVFLPEEVWRTFHPVRKRPTFYVFFR
jgi:DNA-directed RNA polymerase subunit RPC12/RpoP